MNSEWNSEIHHLMLEYSLPGEKDVQMKLLIDWIQGHKTSYVKVQTK